MAVVPVGHETFQPPDPDGFALHAAGAEFLALGLLGTDAAAYGGQGAGGGNDLIGALIVLFLDLLDELGNLDHDRAALHAGLGLALEAAGRFVQGLLLGVAQGHFVEIPAADHGVLRRHRVLLKGHIRHLNPPPS